VGWLGGVWCRRRGQGLPWGKMIVGVGYI